MARRYLPCYSLVVGILIVGMAVNGFRVATQLFTLFVLICPLAVVLLCGRLRTDRRTGARHRARRGGYGGQSNRQSS